MRLCFLTLPLIGSIIDRLFLLTNRHVVLIGLNITFIHCMLIAQLCEVLGQVFLLKRERGSNNRYSKYILHPNMLSVEPAIQRHLSLDGSLTKLPGCVTLTAYYLIKLECLHTSVILTSLTPIRSNSLSICSSCNDSTTNSQAG